MQKIQESLSTGTDSTTGFPVSYHQATRQWKVYWPVQIKRVSSVQYANPKVMRLSNQKMVEALPISADKTGEITTEGQELLNELSSNQKTMEGSPTVEK